MRLELEEKEDDEDGECDILYCDTIHFITILLANILFVGSDFSFFAALCISIDCNGG